MYIFIIFLVGKLENSSDLLSASFVSRELMLKPEFRGAPSGLMALLWGGGGHMTTGHTSGGVV